MTLRKLAKARAEGTMATPVTAVPQTAEAEKGDSVEQSLPPADSAKPALVAASSRTPEAPKTALARNALFGHSDDSPEISEIDIDKIRENPHQVRSYFDEDAIASLSRSIAENGLLQPIVVRRHETESRHYVLVAGERRLRAVRMIPGRKTIFAVISGRDNPQVLSIIENSQRQNLNCIETAEGLKRLMEEGGFTQEQAGAVVGMTVQAVSAHLKVLKLPQSIKDAYPALTDTVSRTIMLELAAVKDPAMLLKLWDAAVNSTLSREELRATAKEAKAKSAETETDDKKRFAAMNRTVKSVRTGILSLEAFKGELADDHRDILRDLRARIDALLGGGA